MKAAVISAAGLPPVYGDFPDPQPNGTAEVILVAASALTQLTRGRAAGTHYSSTGGYPLVPGVDGTGSRLDGRPVYFALPEAPFGGMAERTLVQPSLLVDLPADLDPVKAAALANPGMSCWAALKERAKFIRGESVLVNGATGSAGRLAVQVARFLGARRVVATGRNPQALRALANLGADATVDLTLDRAALEAEFKRQFAGGIDVVLDYLWGPSAEILLAAAAKAAPEGVPVRFVSIGSMAGPELALPSALLRSSGLQLMGSGLRSVPFPRLLQSIADLFLAAGPGRFEIPIEAVPLSQVAARWVAPDAGGRIVFTNH
jgi:NADPH:quinone reductase-like Zn-dependent oxidoreductase